MTSVMGKRGVSSDKIETNILAIKDVSVDNIIKSRTTVVTGSGTTSLATVSYVEDAVDQATALASVFSQNYVSPTWATLSSDAHRWIISGGMRTSNNDLQITTSGTAIIRVPAGRLPVEGEYILGLKGYITPTATITINYGTYTVAEFTGQSVISEMNLSVILNVTDVNLDLTIYIKNGLNSYLYSPVYLCASSALLSFYMSAQLREMFADNGAVTLEQLVEYVRTNAIPLSDKRYMVQGNRAIPARIALVKNEDGDTLELPVYLKSRWVSNSHGPNAPIGQMGKFICGAENNNMPPLFTPTTITANVLNSGIGYRFHNTTRVVALKLQSSIGGIYGVTTINGNSSTYTVVTLVDNVPATFGLSVNAQMVAITKVEPATSDTTVMLDIETDNLSLSVVSGAIVQAVDTVPCSDTEIDLSDVPSNIWYPLVVSSDGIPHVLTAPFAHAAYQSLVSGSAPAVDWVSRCSDSATINVYAASYEKGTSQVITLHKTSSIVGISIAFVTPGVYTVSVDIDGTVQSMEVTSAIALEPIVLDITGIGQVVTISVRDSNNTRVTNFQPNVHLEAIWYDARVNTWSDGIDRVILGYLRKSDTIQFYPRGCNMVQGGRLFTQLESVASLDPDTGMCRLSWNPSLENAMVYK